MSRVCQLSGTKVSFGNNVSHSKRRTSRAWYPNLVKTKLEINGRMQSVKITARMLKTLNKKARTAAA